MNKLDLIKEQFQYNQDKSINYVMIDIAQSLMALFEYNNEVENKQSYHLNSISLMLSPQKSNSCSSFELYLLYTSSKNNQYKLFLNNQQSFNYLLTGSGKKLNLFSYNKLYEIYHNIIMPDESGLNNLVARHIMEHIAIEINCNQSNYHDKLKSLINE